MTNTQIYNQNVKIDASFVNADIDNNPQYLPLEYSAFERIEIVDTINNVSLSGTAILDNFNDSINSNPVFDFAKLYNNLFNFRFEQIISNEDSIVYEQTFAVNDIYTAPQNELVNKLHISFNDVFFSTLQNKTINDASQVSRYKQGLTSDIIKNIIVDYNQRSVYPIGEWVDTSVPTDLQLSPNDSLDCIYSKAYKHNFTSATGAYTDSIFNILKEDGDFMDRTEVKYALEPINKRFLDLYSKIQGGGTLYLQNTVVEGIMESGANPTDVKTGMIKGFSETEEVQILRPDFNVVRDLYRNVVVESVDDSGISTTTLLPIDETLRNFYRLFCNNSNYRLDIPVETSLDINRQSADAVKISAFYPELEPGLTQAKLYNMLLFNSKMITFKVKGQVFRQPGYFIYFQPRRQGTSTVTEKDEHYNSLVGFWYIVQVRHIFEGNAYDNVITCVNPFVRNN